MSPLYFFKYSSTQNNNNNTYIHTVQYGLDLSDTDMFTLW